MSDVKFACPHCEQHIQCDEAYWFAWAGWQRKSGFELLVSGLLTSGAMVLVYMVVGVGILFAGCALL